MKIDCISDLHGFFPKLDGGDLLIVAGDITARDTVAEWMGFFEWFKAQNYRQKVLVGGNHDGFLERCISSQEARKMMIDEQEGFEYLCDSGIEFEGVKIWGSPWTPRFYNWHFMLDRGERIRQKWNLIPDDTNILVTHGPPFGVLDANINRKYVGCKDLGNRILELKELKLHVFGHIHESYGQCHQGYYTPGNAQEVLMEGYEAIPLGHLSVNCSIMDENYNPVNKPITVILENGVATPVIKKEG